LVPIGNAKPDKRITAIPPRARVGQHLAPAERIEDRLRFHRCSVEIVGMNVTIPAGALEMLKVPGLLVG